MTVDESKRVVRKRYKYAAIVEEYDHKLNRFRYYILARRGLVPVEVSRRKDNEAEAWLSAAHRILNEQKKG